MFNALIRQASLGIPPGPVAPFRRSVLIQQILAYLRQVGCTRFCGHSDCLFEGCLKRVGIAARETYTKGLARTQKLVHSLGSG